MAKAFKTLKDPKLQMTDKLMFGKLAGCRVCDVIQDHYEYLIWAEKQGFVKYSQEVTDVILEAASFAKWEAPVEDTPKEIMYHPFRGWTDMEEDVPF